MLTADSFHPRSVQVAGTEVTYYDSEKTHGRDEIVVLVHGTGGSTKAHFGFLFPILAAKQRVVAVHSRPRHRLVIQVRRQRGGAQQASREAHARE